MGSSRTEIAKGSGLARAKRSAIRTDVRTDGPCGLSAAPGTRCDELGRGLDLWQAKLRRHSGCRWRLAAPQAAAACVCMPELRSCSSASKRSSFSSLRVTFVLSECNFDHLGPDSFFFVAKRLASKQQLASRRPRGGWPPGGWLRVLGAAGSWVLPGPGCLSKKGFGRGQAVEEAP